MSAVPSGSPRASADLNVQAANGTSGQETDGPDGSGEAQGPPPPAGTDFGPNQWLVDELYQRYQADPSSVDRAWWSFFADYKPTLNNGNGTGPQPVIATARPIPDTAPKPPPVSPVPQAYAAPAS